MRALKDFLKRSVIYRIERDVPIRDIRYSDQRFYVDEGFGGKPLQDSPLYSFFDEYLHGDESRAKERFQNWYLDQFQKSGHLDKRFGGMYRGSLYNRVMKAHEEAGRSPRRIEGFDPDIVRRVINARVEERFALADAVMREGYKTNPDDPIIAVRKNGTFILLTGHHRCCLLAAMGKKTVPEIRVFRWSFLYPLFTHLLYGTSGSR